METKFFYSHDKIKLNYYVFGSGNNKIILTNAPGMSIKFWIPVINNLIEKDFQIYAMDYRGFQSDDFELTAEQADIENIITDFLQLIQLEKLNTFSLFSWCVGAKVALKIYQRLPQSVTAIVSLNLGFSKHDFQTLGKFGKLMYNIDKKVMENPDYITRMVSIMKEMGAISKIDFLKKTGEMESDSPSLDLYNYIEEQSPLAVLSFYLIDTPIGLRNYLNIYKSFGKVDCTEILINANCPVFAINAENDKVIVYSEADSNVVNYCGKVNILPIKNATHFMLVDTPRRISNIILECYTNIRNDFGKA